MKRTHIGSDAVGAGGGRAEPVREGVALSHIPGSVTCHRVARRLAIRRDCKRAESDDRQRQCTTRVRACFSSNPPVFLPRRNAQPLLRRVCAAANARLRQLQNFSPQPSELDRCQFFALHALQYSPTTGELAVCAEPIGNTQLRRLSSGRTMPVHVVRQIDGFRGTHAKTGGTRTACVIKATVIPVVRSTHGRDAFLRVAEVEHCAATERRQQQGNTR